MGLDVSYLDRPALNGGVKKMSKRGAFDVADLQWIPLIPSPLVAEISMMKFLT